MTKKGQKRNSQQKPATISRGIWIVLAVAVLAISALFYMSRRQSVSPSASMSAASTPSVDTASAPVASASMPPGASVKTESFAPTVVNHGSSSGTAPEGMAWIPGGEFSMGANDPPDMDDVGMKATLDARPIHRVYVDSFYIDKTDVTNAEFAKFVKATGYVTVAERKPKAEDFPGAPPENLVPGSVVFAPPDHTVPLNNYYQWWTYIPGANWRHPVGPESNIKEKTAIRLFKSHTKMRRLMRSGQGSGCRPKLSGSLPHAAAWQGSHSCGATSSGQTGSGWPTRIRDTSPIRTLAQMDMWASRRWRNIPRIHMAYMTWRGMCGNGLLTGIVRTTIGNWLRPEVSHATRKGPAQPTTPPNQVSLRRSSEAALFFAPISIVRAIS